MTSRERHRQRARTREALLAGARTVMRRGETVTVTAAATEAGISKATAYRYFSDPNLLVAEAGLADEVMSYEDITAAAGTVRARIVAISLHFFDLAVAHEMEFRQFLARVLDAGVSAKEAGPRLRGARRVAMFARALEPVDGLGARDRQALVTALCLTTGTEAMISLFDVAGASPEDARAAVRDAVEAILDRFLGRALT